MAREVVFTSKGTVNGKEYKRGAELRVSSSIFKDLTEVQKCAKERKPTDVKSEHDLSAD
jgi:hypothetical protein